MFPTLKRQIKELRNWIVVDNGIEITEFDFQANNWLSKNRRMIVLRQSVKQKSKALGKTL
jgi:hypothetical protein